MEGQFILTFPMFALLLKDGTGTIMLRHGPDIWLPLFTDRDSALTYLERSEIRECLVQELPNPADLSAFLRNPPSRAGNNKVEYVVMDPIGPELKTVTVFKVDQLLASLPK